MSAEKLIASHLRLASDDLREAIILFEASGRNSVYLAEQAAEQIVLALAQSEGVHFGRDLNYQIDRMVARLPDSNRLKPALQRITWLEAYSTTFRYPRPSGAISPPPAPARLQGALTGISELLTRAAEHFEVDLSAGSEKPARHSRPPRVAV